ncbi:MAG: ABC transporter substrate-binding protein [Chloroflexi bacterium]|nr:ABC transporter substrate-binding protein [Chloroflexota bacterium]
MADTGVSRRGFLRVGLSIAGVGLLAACAPAAPATKPAETKPAAPAATTAPAAPAAAAKPTEAPKPAVAAPTAAPAAAAKPAEATKPAAAPAAASGKPESKLGAQLVGKIEGPEIQESRRPAKLGEAPMLTELVKAGKLPPVEQRIPEEPLVLKPMREVGKYGGMWRRGFTGVGDWENFNRVMGAEKPLHVDFTGNKIVPAVAKSWELKDGGKVIRLSLRKGMKWSDGQPFTADDWVFWYEDFYKNKDILPVGTAEMSINGKPGEMVKVDETTIEFRFPEPYPMFVDVLSAFTQMGGGHALGGTQWGGFMGPYAPAHYIKQFHPKHIGADKANEMAKAAGMDGFIALLKFKNNYALNPECPVITPWRTVTPINTPLWSLERNPYYWGVDTDGNQLPYIDKIQMTLGENLEVVNLRAIAGEYDEMGRHMDVAKLPIFLENQQKGNYKVVLDLQSDAAAVAIHINQSFDADPEIRKWLTNVDFRRALSMGMDRDQFNEAFFLGMATPSSLMSEDSSPENAGPEWRTRWSTLDLKQANELLDKIGLTKKDPQGMRLRTDNGQVLRITVTTVAAAFLPYAQMMEMVGQHWKKIGIQLDVKDTERNLSLKQVAANEQQLYVWGGGNADIFMWPRHDMPAEPNEPFSGTQYATWYASGGTAGKKPEDPELLKGYELLRKGSGLEQAERAKVGQELKKLIVDQQWVIGTVGFSPVLRVIGNKLGNVPDRYGWRTRNRTPGHVHPSTYYFKS